MFCPTAVQLHRGGNAEHRECDHRVYLVVFQQCPEVWQQRVVQRDPVAILPARQLRYALQTRRFGQRRPIQRPIELVLFTKVEFTDVRERVTVLIGELFAVQRTRELHQFTHELVVARANGIHLFEPHSKVLDGFVPAGW
ncbi:hypothetical protein D3C78_1488190 [compost metagenome]